MSIDGDGNDNILDGTSGDDTINGFAGDDTINGNAGNDTINGGDDNDWIDGGLGDDVIDAGDGDDYVIYDANDTTLAIGGSGTDILVYNDGEYVENNSVTAQGFELAAERYTDGTDDVYDVYDLTASYNYIEERRFHQDGTFTITVFDFDDSQTWSDWIRVYASYDAYLADEDGVPGNDPTYEEFVDDNNGGGGNTNTAPEDFAPVTEDLVLTVTGNLFTDDLLNNPAGVYVLTEIAGIAVPGTGTVSIVGTFGTLEVAANGDYTYNLDNSLVQDFTADDIIPDTFAYNFTEDGFGLNTDLIIEITGNNDAPVASDNTATVQENINLQATGNVITDDDGFGIDSDIENQPIGIVEVNSVSLNPTGTTLVAGTYGTLTIDGATGDYTYDLDNNLPAVQALDFGDTLVDSFTYSLTDGSVVTTADLDVTIEGSDTSVQAFADINSTTEDDVVPATGNVLDNDFGLGITVTNVNATAVAASGDTVIAGAYGTLTISADGAYSYLVDPASSAAQELKDGETLTETFTYTAENAFANTENSNLTVTINGVNDVAVVTGDDTAEVTEDAGNPPFDLGILVVNDADAGESSFLAGNYNGTYGTVALTAQGSYTYTLNNSDLLVQSLGAGITATDTVAVQSFDGSTHNVTVTITGVNDVAVVGGDDQASVTEDDDPLTLTDSGILTVADVDTGEAEFNPETIAGTHGSLTIDALGNWTYSADNTPLTIQQLGATATLTETITVSTIDGTTHDIDVVINGTNDAAIIGGVDTGSVKEEDDPVTLTASGALTISDIDLGEEVFNANTTPGSYGSLTIDAAGNWTYSADNTLPAIQALGEGSSLVDTITIQSIDGTTHDVSVTINGTNDAAVISVGVLPTVTEDDSPATLTGLGTINITDIDTGEAQFNPSNINGLYGALTLDAAGNASYSADNTQAAIQSLGAGSTLTDTITITSVDGTSFDVHVVINGTNDAAVIAGVDTGDVTEDGGALQVTTGTLTISDIDTGEELFTVGASAGTYGSVTIDANGNWTYTLDNANAAVQALPRGATMNDVVTITAIDGTTHDITVTITGTNDAAVIGGVDTGGVTEDGGVAETVSGTLTISDVDTGEEVFIPGTFGPGTIEHYGAIQLSVSQTNAYQFSDGVNPPITLTQTGADIGPNSFSGWSAIQVEATDTGFLVLWNHTDGRYITWQTDAAGVYQTSTVVQPAELSGLEPQFSADLDSDGFIDGEAAPQLLTGTYGSLTIDAAGNWTYALDNANADVQALPLDATLTDTVSVAAIDGTAHDITVTITGTNDAAVIAGVDTGGVTEDGGVAETVSGTLTISDIDTGEELFRPGTYGPETIEHNGAYQLSVNAGGLYEINNGIDTPVTMFYNGGDVGPGTLSGWSAIQAEATDTGFSVLWNHTDGRYVHWELDAAGVYQTSSLVQPAGLSALEPVFAADLDNDGLIDGAAAPQVHVGAYGSLTIDAAGNWTYTLDNDNAAVQALGLNTTMTDTVTVSAIDGTTHDISVTITGTNDAAVIAGVDTGAVTEDGGALQVTTGTLTVSDGDTGEELFTVGTVAGTYGSLTIDAAGAWTYTLDNANAAVQALPLNATLNDVVTVTSVDGTTHDVTITISGTNDAAVIAGVDTGNVTEDGGVLQVTTGTLTISDVDTGEELFAAGGATGTYGSVAIDASGNWTYTLDNANAAVQALPLNATLNDVVTVTAVDGTTHDITVTITGINDAAVVGGDDQGAVTEDNDPATLADTGLLTISDVDTGEAVFTAETIVGAFGSLTINAAGNWTYTADNTQPAIQSLGQGETATDTITVSAIDGTTHNIDVVITGINDAPETGLDDIGTITSNGTSILVSSLLSNDTDAEGDTLTLTEIDGNAIAPGGSVAVRDGTVTMSGDGSTLTFIPTPSYSGPTSFNYTASDGIDTGEGTVTTEIEAVAGDDSLVVSEDAFGTVNVLANDDVVVSTVTGFTITTQPANGSLVVNPDLTVTYTPDPDYNGPDQFEYQFTGMSAGLEFEFYRRAPDDDTVHNITDENITATGIATEFNVSELAFEFQNNTNTYGFRYTGYIYFETAGLYTFSTTSDDGSNLSIDGNEIVDNDGIHSAVTETGQLNVTTPGYYPLEILFFEDTGDDILEVTVSGPDTGNVEMDLFASGLVGHSLRTDTATIDITVNPVNDPAAIAGVDTGTLTEDETAPQLATSGALTISDIDDPAEEVFAAGNFNGDIGSVAIDAAGNWTYTAPSDNASIQALGAGETLIDTVTVSSVDGTQHDITITITGTNDAAVIGGGDTGGVIEDGGATEAVSGALTISDVDTGEELFAAGASAGTYGSVTIDANGNWTYTLDNANADVQALPVNATLNDVVTITAVDGTTHDITITINGTNDAAVIGGVATGGVTEDGGVAETVSGVLTISDIDTGEELFTVGTSVGTFGSVSIDAAGAWTYTLDNANVAVQALPLDATMNDVVTVTAIDGTTHDITITITGTNDAAVIAGVDTGGVTEDGGVAEVVSGTLTISDIDTGEELFRPGTYGPETIEHNGLTQLSVSQTNAYEFSDGINAPIILTQTGADIGPDSFSGWSAIQAEATDTGFSVLWNHTDGRYIIWQTDAAGVYQSSTVVQPAELTGLEPVFVADLDNDGFIDGEAAPQIQAGTYGSLTIDAAGNWTYTLDNANADVQALPLNATLNDVVTVTAVDGTTHDITVTITGTNDAAVIAGVDTGNVTEDGGPLQVTTGTLTISDIDTGEELFTVGGATGTYGSVAIDANGNWTYTLDNANAAVQALPLNATLNDVVTVTAIDGTTHDITITITGTNDAAVIAGVDTGDVTEDGGPLQITTGTLTISDVDTGEALFTAGGATGTYGSATIDANGNWTYTLDNANAAVQALPLNATMNDVVTVTAIDGTTHDITITITGTNDAATIAGVDTGDVTEDGGAQQVTTGTLTIADTDTGEEQFTVDTVAGTYGSLAIDANGNWTYTLDNANAAVQALPPAATLNDVVTVTAVDGTTHDITVTINGTNDPTVAVDEAPVVVAPGQTVNIDVLANDSDVDNVTQTVTGIIDPADPSIVLQFDGSSQVTLASGTVIELMGDGTLNITEGVVPADIETFQYEVTSSDGGTAQATVTLHIDTDGDTIANLVDIDDDNDGIIDINEAVQATGSDSGIDGALLSANVSFGISSADLNDQDGDHVLTSVTVDGKTFTDFVLPDSYAHNFTASVDLTYQKDGATEASFSGSVDWNADILPAFQSTDLNDYQESTSDFNDGDYYQLSYNTPLFVTAGTFVGVTERGGNNPVEIRAYDSNGDPLGDKILVSGSDYLDTGARQNSTQNAEMAIYALDDLAPVGSDIASIRVFIPENTGGPDGKVFVFGDGVAFGGGNRLDLDSDNDGITDNVEAQATDNYIAPSGVDVDQDGLDDAYDADTGSTDAVQSAGLTPVDSDGDGFADYVDFDSDDDGLNDAEERGDGGPTSAASTADADGDGLLDVFEGSDANDGFDVNDENIDDVSGNFNLGGVPNLLPDGSNADNSIDLAFRDVNDAPVAADNTAGVTEDTDLDHTGNVLTDDDGSGVDSDVEGDSLSVTGAGGSPVPLFGSATIVGVYGTLQISRDGAYTYTLDNTNPAVQALAPGETLTEILGYEISDGSLTATASLTITINGTADDPIIIQGDGNDNELYGADNDDVIDGLDSDDTISGFGGDDTLNGGNGADTLIGGAGADTLNGGSGFDWASYRTATEGVVVNLSDTSQNTGDAAGDQYSDIDMYEGSAFNDTLIGNTKGNFLAGGEGDDTLAGGAGNDALVGGLGADVLNGGEGFDNAAYVYATSGVTVDLSNAANNTGEAFGDTFIGIEMVQGSLFDDTITGDTGDNWLYGYGGNDTVNGGAGADVIFGNDGSDILSGGAGSDTFYFLTGDTGTDTITDFEDDFDQLDLRFSGSFSSTQQVLDAASSSGADTVIDLGGGNSIVLQNFAFSNFNETDFLV